MIVALLVLAGAAVEPSPSPPPPPTERARRLTAEERRARPRPSDPWSFARDVPGVVLDRVDVGGSETGQQSLLVSRGDSGAGATWSIDGADVTDPAAPGFAAFHPDLALAGAVEMRTETIDVRVRTPGVQVGIALPEPGVRWTGRASVAGSIAQSDNLPRALQGRPFLRSRTDAAREMAADAGGPAAADRLWLWGGIARRSLSQALFTGHDDAVRTTWLMGKARVRVGGARLSLVAARAEKIDEDRDATLTAAPEARWRQSGPSSLLVLEGRAAPRGIAVLARASRLRSGFTLAPRGGVAAATYEDFRGVTQRSYLSFDTERPRDAASVEASAARRGLGLEHLLLAGGGFARSVVETRSQWPGNQVLGLERSTVFFRAFELTGFAIPTRGQSARTRQEEAYGFVQDEARRGRLAFSAGARLDSVRGRTLASQVAANPELPALLPAVSYAGGADRIRWLDLLPRASVAWDLAADGRATVGLSYAEYAAALSAADVAFDDPVGREVASLTYYWADANGDHIVQAGELDLVRGRVGAAGVDPEAPGAVVSPHAVDPGLRAPRTRALGLGARHTGGAWSASLQGSWRRLAHPLWRPLRNLSLGDYAIRGAVAGEIHGEPYEVGYYAPASASRIVPGNGRVLANREGYHQDALTVEAIVAGRWRRVRAEAWVSATDWRERFTDRERAVQDPTQVESDPLIDGGAVAARPGGLGRGDVVVNARWTAGASATARLPLGIDASAVLHAREGFPVPYFQVAETGDPTGGGKAVLVASRLDRFRLPALVLVDAGLARTVRTGRAAVTFSLDGFNLLDAATTLQAARDVDLASLDRPREIVRPRLVRAGVAVGF